MRGWHRTVFAIACWVGQVAARAVAAAEPTVRVLSRPAKDLPGVAIESEKQREVEY